MTPVARAAQVLDAVYDDTPDMKPARWAITARHRSGEGSSARTLKLPGGDNGPAPLRREVRFQGPGPAGARRRPHAPRALCTRNCLVPMAHMKTIRNGYDLVDGEGTEVAGVVDDEVWVLHSVAEAWLRGLAPSPELADSSAVDHPIECQRADAARRPKRLGRTWKLSSNARLRSS